MPPSEKLPLESLCPACQSFDYHWLVELVEGIAGIPPRYVLRCVECNQIFYRVKTDADTN